MRKTVVNAMVVTESGAVVKAIAASLAQSSNPTFHVIVVADVGEALVVAKKEGIDAVLLDLSLPDVNGIEAVAAFRVLAPDTTVIVVAVGEEIANAQRYFAQGARGYLPRPQIRRESLRHNVLRAVAEHWVDRRYEEITKAKSAAQRNYSVGTGYANAYSKQRPDRAEGP